MAQLKNPIAAATSFDTAITLIPSSLCLQALASLTAEFKHLFPDNRVSVVPIAKGGNQLGAILALAGPVRVNPMRISYYDEQTRRRSKPACLYPPHLDFIIKKSGRVLPVVFTEAVVDTQNTLNCAISTIKNQFDALNRSRKTKLPYPKFYVYALASKTPGGKINLPGLAHGRAMFSFHPSIWIHGYGCDDGGQGRESLAIKGRLAPNLNRNQIPRPPYATIHFPVNPDLIPEAQKPFLEVKPQTG
ncbi:hypothetical protein A3D86_01000 [Candidatus Beckwithbacteria bacterium RIFCSPHIGHO2_02_FULL_49_13]|nr:MAG: hypothetical protein A3D86_01000 [Candidatus Beckwithbacteria bacterium RIFCSPHIGHO2_02_FULL_49_13]